jgi:3-hydroxyacyl-[acyl-carrier-protein] dehydratase
MVYGSGKNPPAVNRIIEEASLMIEINDIKKKLPHRYPFLLVDRIIAVDKGRKAIGIKNITGDDFFCNQDYFERDSVFPASLQVEAMAQVSGFIMKDLVADPAKLAVLASIESARFRKAIKPGDQLRIEVNLKKYRSGIGRFAATSYVDNELAAELVFTCIVINS